MRELWGNPANRLQVMGQHQLQFEDFGGRTFLWVVENVLGYAAYITYSVAGEMPMGSRYGAVVALVARVQFLDPASYVG